MDLTKVCNLGLRVDTFQGVINRIEQVRLVHPDKVYIMTEINDVANRLVYKYVENGMLPKVMTVDEFTFTRMLIKHDMIC